MQHTQASLGRIFVIRLEHGEEMPEALEQFASEHGITSGLAIMIGGLDDGSKLVVGPEDGTALPVNPMVRALCGVHEVAAVGTLFPDADGQPVLHMHAACGRSDRTTTGCTREGIAAWQVLEIILVELTDLDAVRRQDPDTGFALLQCRSPSG